METAIEVVKHEHEGEYDAFIQRISNRFNGLSGPVFETDAKDLYAIYLASFSESNGDRQYHTCKCCQNFIERFGHLAIVGADGTLISAIWDAADAPSNYLAANSAMARAVRRAKITMPFLSSESLYGTPISGERKDGSGQWRHFAVEPVAARIYKPSALKNAFQAASEKREEFGTVMHALADYSKETVATALNLLKNDQLGNSAAAVAQAQFLADLHAINLTGDLRRNLVFAAVAAAPSGFCHPRSGMIATLLDDIAAGKSFDSVQAAWNAKMHPLAYQRPQAAPTAGAIKAAEEAFEKMGAASALKRRYALLDDVLEKLWAPKPAAAPAAGGGIFASVKAKGDDTAPVTMLAPAVVMTWAKFARNVLPTADKIEAYAETTRQAYTALTTQVDPEALPLLQWDSAERRNPVALYVYNGGSSSPSWNLESRKFHKVNAITLRPSMWFDGEFSHQPQGAILILDGCHDTRGSGMGSALFPSTIRSEFHGVRAVVEAYSNANDLEGREQATACGLLIGAENTGKPLLRVTSAGQMTEYRIDRWD